MRTAEGQTEQQEITTQVTTPALKVDVQGPASGIVDVPINFVIRLSNPGTGDLENIQLFAEYDKALEHEQIKDKKSLNTSIDGVIKPGGFKDVPLILTPREAGALGVKVRAVSGGLQAMGQKIVNVQKPNVSLKIQGIDKRYYVGRFVEWKIIVKNEGEGEQTGVVVRDRLPVELGYTSSSRGGSYAAGEVTWFLGTLKPGEEVALDLKAECQKAALAAEKLTVVTGDGNANAQKLTKVTIEGIAAIQMKMKDEVDPVEVGKNVIYNMTLTNTGSAPAKMVAVKATLPIDKLKALTAKGPTKETIAGPFITFAPVDVLQPGQTIQFTFVCEAVKEGDARFRVEYTSDLNVEPIYETEPTTIAPRLMAPVPAPGVGVPKPLPPGGGG